MTASPAPSAKIPVLILGLPRGHPSARTFPMVLSGQYELPKILEMVKKNEELLAASPYDAETIHIGDEKDYPVLIEKLKEKEWRGVVMSFGIRGHPDMTEIFENMVNLTSEYAPQAKIGFNSNPQDTVEALKRVVPV